MNTVTRWRVSKVNGTRIRLDKNAIKIARAWGGTARVDCYYGQRKYIFFSGRDVDKRTANSAKYSLSKIPPVSELA